MKQTTRMRRSRYSFAATICLIIALLCGQATAFAATASKTDGPLTLISETRVSEGTILKQYEKILAGNKNKILVTEIDLNNPYVKVAPIYGKDGQIDKQPITKMADENGAVVAINANFFHLTQRPAPFAMEYKDGELISSQSVLHDWMVFSVTNDQTAQIGTLGFSGQVTTMSGATYPIFNLNKEIHNTHEGNSHENRLNLYNSRWKGTSIGTLPDKTGVVEVVVENGFVTDIRIDQPGVPIPANGYVLMGHGTAANFLSQNVRLGEYLQVSYDVTPDASNIAQAIGAHALLVDQGAPVIISPKTDFSGAKTDRARSGIGISQDGKKVYFIAVEKSSTSHGVNLDNFARIIAELGIWRAANLDGGGSTTLVSRMPGDASVTLLNTPDGGSIRSVPDGIAVFNLATPGNLAGIVLNSSTTNLLVGSKVIYTAKGYDEHVLPYNVYRNPITWSSQNTNVGSFVDNSFIAKASGTTNITVSSQGIISNPLTLNVFGGKDIAQVEVTPSSLNVLSDFYQPINIQVKTKTGVTFKATSDNIKWAVEGVEGAMDGLTYRSGSSAGVGQLKGTIDGFTFSIPIKQGAIASNFNTLDYVASYSHSHYPSKNPGSFVRVNEASSEPIFRGIASMKLTYNFLANTFDDKGLSTDPVEAAYGDMNDIHLTFPQDALGFGVWVYGDNSNYAVKAQIKDHNGKVYYVPLADRIDWAGWKYLEANFTPDMTARPLSLKNLYIVDEPNASLQDRPLTGSVYFDELIVLRPYDPTTIGKATTIKPSSKDKATDLNLSLGPVDLHIAAADIEKRASQYTVTPVSVTKYNKPIPGEYPYMYGFDIALTEKGDSATSIPVMIKPKNDLYFALMHWSETEGKWNKLVGYPTPAGALRFELPTGGIYIPVKNDDRISFTDIATHWARASVAEMTKRGIIKGVSATEYKPNDTLTRGEIATLIYRVVEAQRPEQASELLKELELKFADSIPDWAMDGAVSSVNLGVINGIVEYGETKFASTGQLTREQLATIIARSVEALQLTTPESSSNQTIADQATVPEWAAAGVKLAVEQKLFPLVDGKFLPKQKVTRGEAAYVIAQIYHWLQASETLH